MKFSFFGNRIPVVTCVLFAWVTQVGFADELTADDISRAINSINNVKANGVGHEDAVVALKVLNAASSDQIPMILAGMDNANNLATNWLRSAVVSIAARSENLPVTELRAYFDDKSRGHLGRLVAFELLTENKPELADRIIPTLVDDPSLPLRYKAIEHLIESAETAAPTQSIGMLGTAIDKARDVDQVIQVAKLLKDKGISIDLQDQLGFISQWHLVGSFDNKNGEGFDIVHGPEKALDKIDLDAQYDSMDGQSKWQAHATSHPTGVVDLNKVIGKLKGATVYACAIYDCDVDRDAEVRIGCINAHKVWVNGTLAISNNVNHNGMSPDKFIGNTTLHKGQNEILVKVCQNEQTEPWAQSWMFQLRVCDETGKALEPAESKFDGLDDDSQ